MPSDLPLQSAIRDFYNGHGIARGATIGISTKTIEHLVRWRSYRPMFLAWLDESGSLNLATTEDGFKTNHSPTFTTFTIGEHPNA